MYYYLLALWIVYGALVLIYIMGIDDKGMERVRPSSAVILTIVAGPTMWLVVVMAFLLPYLFSQ